jgi:hypothetical protein
MQSSYVRDAAPGEPMRVMVGDKPQESLTAAEEAYIRLSRKEDSVQGSILSADEATRAYVGSTKWLFIILNSLVLVVGLGLTAMAEASDQPLLLGGVAVINALLALFFFFLLQRRTKTWNAKLAARVSGLPATGSAVSLDASGLGIAAQVFPWATLAIDQVEFAAFHTRNNETTYLIDRLSLAAPTGRVVLDPAMMKNGLLIVDNTWRRLRSTAP